MAEPDSPNPSPPTDAGRGSLARVLLGSLCLFLASTALGLLVNHFSPRGLPLFPPAQSQAPAALPLPAGIESISPEQAYAAFQSRTALFVDARTPEEYAKGHIPGALNLPPRDFDARFPDLADRVESAPQLIVYCRSLECSDAIETAERLHELIPKPVGVFARGWEVWRPMYPSTKGDRP